ncbi:hypothetical protein A2U01_0103700, partial [Trifolium medium]|nr:hypothetical protein [Trifolium medium]
MLEQAEKALTRVNALGFTVMEENASIACVSNPHLERPEISEVHETTSGKGIDLKTRVAETTSLEER